MITGSSSQRVGASLLAVSAFLMSACGSSASQTVDTAVSSVTVVVVGLNNDQSRVLTEVYAQALEKGGFRVGRKDPVADLPAGYVALKSGQADLFVTYTGDLLAYAATAEPAASASTSTTASATTITTSVPPTSDPPTSDPPTSDAPTSDPPKRDPPTSSASATADRVTKQINALGEITPRQLLFGAPALAQDKPAIACSKIVATTNSLATFSDLAASADHLTLATTTEFETGKAFGLSGFTKLYGATFQKTVTTDPSKVTGSITKGDVDCGVVRTLDPTVTADMSVLEDDLGLATDEAVIPLLAGTAASPGAMQIIDSVSKVLGMGELRDMLQHVIVNKEAPNIVAGAWLRAAGVTTQ